MFNVQTIFTKITSKIAIYKLGLLSTYRNHFILIWLEILILRYLIGIDQSKNFTCLKKSLNGEFVKFKNLVSPLELFSTIYDCIYDFSSIAYGSGAPVQSRSIAAFKINFKYGGNTARRLHINLFFELCKNLQNIKTHYGSVMHLWSFVG